MAFRMISRKKSLYTVSSATPLSDLTPYISPALSVIHTRFYARSKSRPPKLMLPPDSRPGCDYKHWLVVMQPPESESDNSFPTRDQIAQNYVDTLGKVLGSEEKAKKKIYSISTKHYFAFGALISEQLSCKLKELDNVLWVLPDSYVDVDAQDYGGEPFVNGKVAPYDPIYHKAWDGHLEQVLDRKDWRSYTQKTLNNFLRQEESSLNQHEFDRLCKEGKVKQARELLVLLEREGFQVEISHYFMLMKACGEAGAREEARNVHRLFDRRNFSFEVSSSNRLLEMYCMCGSMDGAWKVFNAMPQHNLTSWDTMIFYLAKNGRPEKALGLFTRLKKQGLKLDEKVFISVFTACSILCDIDEMLVQFKSMSDDYGIIPSMHLYISVVGMLGSRGNLDEALYFISKMPVEPSVEVWNTLMYHSMVFDQMELVDYCAVFIKLLHSRYLCEQSKEGDSLHEVKNTSEG